MFPKQTKEASHEGKHPRTRKRLAICGYPGIFSSGARERKSKEDKPFALFRSGARLH